MRLIMTLPVLAALTLGAVPVHATTYTAGEFVTFTAGAWGTPPDGFNAASLLNNNFGAVFPQIPQPSFGSGPYLAVGIVNSDALVGEADPFRPFSIILTDPQYFLETATTISGYPDYYMPGVPSRLGANYNDFTFGPVTTIPSQSPGGLLAADAVALTLNVDFSDDGLLAHPAAAAFGDLIFQNLGSLEGQKVSLPESGSGVTSFSSTLGSDVALLNGLSLREVLSITNIALSDEFFFHPDQDETIAGELSAFDLDYVLELANGAFDEGLLNIGAQDLALPQTGGGGDPSAPEASTWAMLLIGFAGLGLAGWRSSRHGQRGARDVQI